MKRILDLLPSLQKEEGAQSHTSWFQYAHSFLIHKPIMIENVKIVHDQSRTFRALAWLEGHALPGVEHHSNARAPPPRCHEGTRLQFIEFVQDWIKVPLSNQRLLWLHGPAGVGKSAILQTLAELLEKGGHLGAAVFFPSPMPADLPQSSTLSLSSRDSSSIRIWLTIAYRLATTQPAYCSYLVERVEGDPKIVEQTMEKQFEALIAEPFGQRNLADNNTCIPILIDGLDRCRGHDTQKQILRLVLGFIEKYPGSPLIWIITSRQEEHLERSFQGHVHLGERIQKLVIPVSSDEAHKDVQLFMRDSFVGFLEDGLRTIHLCLCDSNLYWKSPHRRPNLTASDCHLDNKQKSA